ncbi:MAG: DNA polymerase [Candidatus Pacebacteria bacterium]|nr:DNA polymerase [Candidatus Paceibacterota bacterium]
MLIGFDLKELIKKAEKEGKKVPREIFDVGIAYWLLNPAEEEYTPENLTRKYLGKEFDGSNTAFDDLYNFAVKKLGEYKLEKLFYEVEMPLLGVLADMELAGIKVDAKLLKALDKDLEKNISDLVKIIYQESGETFNINSPKQLSHVLFEKLKIDSSGIRKTKSGSISTDVETLLDIKDRHPVVQYILNYREFFKLHSTYVLPIQELIGKDGRVHTTYIQTGTATGRLSSQNPNLQNIPAFTESPAGKPEISKPIGEDWAFRLRKAFVAEPGYKLAAFDYSQIELRVLASLSGDPKMMEAFNNNLDIHKMTAANVFNVPLEKVTPEMRKIAKTLNFGVIYGMGALAFAETSGLSVEQAKKFIEEYFSDFKNIKEWQEEIKAQARDLGYVSNINGRRRWMPAAVSTSRQEAAGSERAAINMPVQGLAADIIKMAMVKIAEEIDKKNLTDKIRPILTIHDELLFEIKGDIMKEATQLISGIMEGVYELEVPIKVNVKTGKNWGEMTTIVN